MGRSSDMVTDWSDTRAVLLGANDKPAGDGNPPAFERNPAADRVRRSGNSVDRGELHGRQHLNPSLDGSSGILQPLNVQGVGDSE